MALPTRAIEARRLKFTPELLAHVRQRFEHSDEPISSMAADLGCCNTTLRGIAKREGWVRYVPLPRDLTPAARLQARAEAMAAEPPPERGRSPSEARRVGVEAGAETILEATPTLTLPLSGGGNGEALAGGGEEEVPRMGGGAEEAARASQEMPPVRETTEQLYAAVVKELAEFKALRAQLKGQPLGLLERERSARTLSSLTATLHRLQVLRCAVPASGSHHDNDYDDMPADIDAFRHELARRIRAFVASRSDRSDAGGDGTGSAAAAQ